jgi:hypothetical protein
MSMRRGRALGLIVVGVVGLLAGCKGSPSSRISTVAKPSTAGGTVDHLRALVAAI